MTDKPSDIRAAILQPNRLAKTPGYFLILGKVKDEDSDTPRLLFMTETEEGSTPKLIQSLVMEEAKYRFHTVYTDPYPMTPGNVPPQFILTLHKYLSRKTPWVKQRPGMYADDVAQGFVLFEEWEGRRKVPKETKVAKQSFSIDRADAVSDFEGPDMYAFTALRYILAGYQLDRSPDLWAIKSAREDALRVIEEPKLDSASRSAAKEYAYIMAQIKAKQEAAGGLSEI